MPLNIRTSVLMRKSFSMRKSFLSHKSFLIRKSVLTAGLVVVLATPFLSAAFADEFADSQCRIVGAISHRCYTFHSDATWREGLPDYHGSNGG